MVHAGWKNLKGRSFGQYKLERYRPFICSR